METYGSLLCSAYEKALLADDLSDMVLAYRKGSSTNINHALSLFDEIDRRKNCIVFGLDISGFFDCLNHNHLKQELISILGCVKLDGHDWNVFKNITKYSWVETDDINYILGSDRKIRGRICTPQEFTDHVKGRSEGLVRTHEDEFGIPQGTPISGLYANIYMRSFDREVSSLVARCGGSYRRYSDDIAIVLPRNYKASHVVRIVEKLLADVSLSISENKTETATFSDGKLISRRAIQYLGFVYDGRQKLIRPSSLDAYRAKMRRGIHAKLVAGKSLGVAGPNVFRREALSRYTHLGKRRNFLKYAYSASDIMQAPEIRLQVKNHMTWFERVWNRETLKVFRES